MMNKRALLIHEDTGESGIWVALLRQIGLEVVSLDLQAKELDSLENRAFDVIVIQCRDFGMDVNALCTRLRSMYINPILWLAQGYDEECLLEAYKAGVDDCLSTSISPRLFLAKMSAWLRRSLIGGTAILESIEAGSVKLDSSRRELVTGTRPPLKLTNLEFRVLHLLMSHAGQVLETDFILDHVWGYAGHDERVLLKNVIYRLRRKIEPGHAPPTYIHTINGAGYSFHPV